MAHGSNDRRPARDSCRASAPEPAHPWLGVRSDRDVAVLAEHGGSRAKRAWKAAGLRPIGLHEARHTYASYCIAAGMDFKAISEYMGHASVAITIDRYGKLQPASLAENAAKLDAYFARARSQGRSHDA